MGEVTGLFIRRSAVNKRLPADNSRKTEESLPEFTHGKEKAKTAEERINPKEEISFSLSLIKR